MSATILIQAQHTAKEVGDALSRVWPDVLILLYRPGQADSEESLLAPNDKLKDASSNSATLEATMTGREVSDAFHRAFGLSVEISVESGKSVLNVPLNKAR